VRDASAPAYPGRRRGGESRPGGSRAGLDQRRSALAGAHALDGKDETRGLRVTYLSRAAGGVQSKVMPANETAGVAAPARRGLAARMIGVVLSPRATFEVVAADPRWLGVLAVTVLVSAFATTAFMSSQRGQEALLDRQVSTMESFGVEVTDEMYSRLQAQSGRAPYWAAAQALIGWPLLLLAGAGLLYAGFSLAGGGATFRQVFSVLAHSTVILLLQQLYSLPLAYARGSLDSATTLSVFAPMVDETTFLGRLLGVIDLFWIWWLVVLAVGLSVLYRRRAGSIFAVLAAIYAVVAIAIAAFMARLGG